VALTLAQAAIVTAAAGRADSVDVAAVSDEVASIRKLADQLRSARGTLTGVRKSVDGLSDTLGELRSDLLERASGIERAVATAVSSA